MSGPLHVTFFSLDGSIAVGGKHVCRGVAARLLYECVRLAVDHGRYEFTHRELKRLPALVLHPKNSGFETRLQRLRAALDDADAGIAMEPRGRGRFALVTSGRLELDPVSQRLP